ncbi:fungal-specific transcription factor domain-containing protein, partial [Cryomyces antarcticus]
KRRRIALACTACRIRKSRCNGGRPKCSLCEQMGFGCNYETSDAAANVIVSKWSMSDFEERINWLEGKVRTHDALLSSRNNDILLRPTVHATSSAHRAIDAEDPASSNEVVLQEEPQEDMLTDGMAITFVSEDDSGFFGSSSNIAFMRRITRAMKAAGRVQLHTPNMSEDLSHIDNGVVSVSRPASLPGSSPPESKALEASRRIHNLPPEHETRDLLRRYFSNTGLLFPFIHEVSFFQEYEAMQSEPVPKVRRTWLGLLNMVLAMATSTLADPEKSSTVRRKESDVFYQRAYELCKGQILQGASLETVQYLLLMGQYLQGTQKSVQTWATHGLAVKAAYSLGLHSSDANTRYSPIVQETRRRTWYGCVVLDRSLSMTFGRPHAIPEDHVRLSLPMPLDEELVSTDGINSAKAMSVHFFVDSIKLYQVQYKVISALYDQNLGCGQPLSEMQTATEVFKLEQELNLWQRCVAPPLCIQSHDTLLYDNQVACEERFRVILTLRYLNLQILLHRPFVTRSLDARASRNKGTGSMSSAERLASGSIQTCVKSAEEVISIVHTIISAKRAHDLLGAWWFSLYYVFGASLTIFGTLLISPDLATFAISLTDRLEQGRASLRKASDALRQLDVGNQVATRCADYLSEISSLLDRWQSSSTFRDETIGDFALPQELFQCGEVSLPSFQGLDLAGSQTTSDGLYMNDFSLNDLEMGQFFIPDDFGKWAHPTKNKVA